MATKPTYIPAPRDAPPGLIDAVGADAELFERRAAAADDRRSKLTIKALVDRVVARGDLQRPDAELAVGTVLQVLGRAARTGRPVDLSMFSAARPRRASDRARSRPNAQVKAEIGHLQMKPVVQRDDDEATLIG